MRWTLLSVLFLFLLAACGGDAKNPADPGGEKTDGTGKMKTLERASPDTTPTKPDTPAVDPLAELTTIANLAFEGGDSDAQLEAIEKIRSGGGDKAARARLIARALDSEDEDVRSYAVEVLGKMEIKPLKANVRSLLAREEAAHVRKQAVNTLFILDGRDAVPDLVKVLSDDEEDYTVRAMSAQLLGRAGSPLAVRPLMTALEEDFNDSVRREAVVALATLKAKEATDLIIEALVDGNALVRTEAAKALGMMKEKKAVRPLLDALDPEREDEVQVLEAVSKSLGQIAGFDEKDMVDFLYSADQTEAQQKAAVANWKEWWEENKAAYE